MQEKEETQGLHGYVRKEIFNKHPNDQQVKPVYPNSIKTASTRLEAEVMSLCVVPVRLSHSSSPKSITTYALLDNGSQGTLIKGDFLDELNIRGVGTSISITPQ